MSAEERLAALLHKNLLHNPIGGVDDSLARLSCEQNRDGGRCHRWATTLIAAGVSVPTEPGAPDPRYAWCEACGYAHPVDDADCIASHPVPGPESSARLREALITVANCHLTVSPQDSLDPLRPFIESIEGVRIDKGADGRLTIRPLDGTEPSGSYGLSITDEAIKGNVIHGIRVATPQDPEA